MIIIILLCLTGGFLSVLLYYNKAFPEALELANEMVDTKDRYTFNGRSKIGFIIFPGVKADERAYSYLASLLNQEGHTVVIPKVRFHLSASADQGIKIMTDKEEITRWYLIGHSAGGIPLSRIALSSPEKIEGIVLLASYILSDLSEYNLRTLRISASDDGIMNEKRMLENLEFLPENAINLVLEGTNHQGFGAYDSFSKDGEATMTWQEQQEETVKLILELVRNK